MFSTTCTSVARANDVSHIEAYVTEYPIDIPITADDFERDQWLIKVERAEDAVRRGNWVAGWVCYEAAPAFDPALVVRGFPGTPLEDLPLVWFAVFESRGGAGPAGPGTLPGILDPAHP